MIGPPQSRYLNNPITGLHYSISRVVKLCLYLFLAFPHSKIGNYMFTITRYTYVNHVTYSRGAVK